MIDKNGYENTSSELLGAEIFTNENKSFAKIVDLDVDFQVSSLFGLRFGLKHKGMVLFIGNYTPCVIVHDMWQKIRCTKYSAPPISILFGVQSTSKIVDIDWSNSTVISEFKLESQKSSNELQVSITLDCNNCNTFTMGRVYGTIGITNSKEPLCVGGERKMEPVDVDPDLFNFDDAHPCTTYSPDSHEKQSWTNGAPFKFDSKREVAVIDLSNALPTYFTTADYQRTTAPIDLGDLYVGYILKDNENIIVPIGDTSIPYLSGDTWNKAGIIEIPTEKVIQNHNLVIFKYSDISHFCFWLPGNKYFVKSYYSYFFAKCTEVSLVLKEMEFFIRPMGYYMARLENSSQLMHPKESFITNSHEFTLLVTKHGQPVDNREVTIIDSYNQFGDETHMQLPLEAVKCDKSTKATNETGHVTFKFTLEKTIPNNRYYSNNPNCTSKAVVKDIEITSASTNICSNSSHYSYDQQVCNVLFCDEDECNFENSATTSTYYKLPIDGQVYNFYYCIGNKCELPKNDFFLYKALLSILAFSDVNCTSINSSCSPNWVDDVKDYFEQQHHLVYAMRNVLDLSNYNDVTLHHNIELLKLVLSKDSKEDFDMDPNYMPTTRNLSPAKRNVILKWLNNPHKTVTHQNSRSMPTFARCLQDSISYYSDPQDLDVYFRKAVAEEDLNSLLTDIKFPPSPLFGLRVVEQEEMYPTLNKIFNNHSYHPICNLTNLQAQLQQAVQLEFYTIPLYLTALYSIKEGYNTRAYQTMRNVVMQEMLHMVQAANILIAIGGKVMIDDPKFAPSYPATGLPGGVLRNLTVHLKNYNLIHVHNTFMGIELPTPHKHNLDDVSILYTIGMFYQEIESCIKNLTDNIFKQPKVEDQVEWPWKGIEHKVGTVYIINDTSSSILGINEIIEQGEGANSLDPKQIDTGMYAHFYQFEELVCQKALKKLDNGSYAFKGDPIIYDEAGVYPMINDPKNTTFQPGSRCYTQARAFHRVYRNLLKVLQKTFNGEPEEISEAVKLMESLQVHAKRCISTPYSTPYDASDYNCGPVWDYEWD